MPLKILEFIDGFNFENFGGAGRVFIETAKVLSAQGHQIDVICRNDLTGNYDNPYGIKFHHYDCKYFWFYQKYLHRRNSIRKLTKAYLAENKPDIIIIHSSSAIFGIISLLEELPARKLYVFHSPWCEEHRVNGNEAFPFNRILYWLRRKRELKALEICDGIITLSQYMKNLMLEIHPEVAGKPVAVIPGGADLEKFSPAVNEIEKMECRRKFGIPERSFVLMTSRRLIPRTGVDILVRAFASAKMKTGKDMKLLIVGSGILLEELKSLSLSLDMDKDIIFTGFVDEAELPSCYRASDLFIMPTKELEGFGLSTVEAMACGIPAIGTDIGGTPEILGEVSEDLIIKGCSEDAIAENLIRFSTRESLAGLGEKSLECVKRIFNWNMNVEKLNEFQGHIAVGQAKEEKFTTNRH
ncbi:MAG TPA: hypothetical protein DET40_11330 [Lentisphaeria bacterium]|nr:MAG: hypothetical protein A2X45_19860 [Lentisphaerae bacterium GWF2_50_93]HCE44131.1 hypothetical protein [Lentisphaeria bacterium]